MVSELSPSNCAASMHNLIYNRKQQSTFSSTQVSMQHPFAFTCHVKTNCPSDCCPDLHVEKSTLKIREKYSLIPLLQTATSSTLRLHTELHVLEDQFSLNFFSNMIKQCYLNTGEPPGTYGTCKLVLPVKLAM